MSGPTPIHGAYYPRDGGGGILPDPPTRLEIHDFVKHEKFFSLYVQALHIIYSEPSRDLFSYYQIGGIHGLPHVTWNQAPGGTDRGYCVHGSPIFGPWHRPYVAAVEQVIQEHALDLAATYKVDKEEWEKAATELRQPFWDWSLPNPMPPDEVIALDKVKITQPDGSKVDVPNPFLGFRFQSPRDIETFGRWDTTPKTVRRPQALGPDAETDLAALKEELKKSRTEDTRDLLLEVHDWDTFSTAAASNSNDRAFTSSLEAMHGSVHVSVGGMGHMGSVPVAGFDPIFYMHHCQVDRLMSLWSALNPGKWVPADQLNTNLAPFWDTPTTFWTSAQLKLHRVLNYNYPEFKDFEGNDEQLKQHIKAIVERLYPAANAPLAGIFPAWTVRIKCKQHEADCSFAIPITIDKDGHSIVVGSGDFFVNNEREGCANCREQVAAGLETQAFVHLDVAFDSIGLSELPDIHKVEYLKKNLHWRVDPVDHTAARLPSLEITVMKNPVQLRSGELPTVGKPTYFPEITHGREG